MYLRQFQYVLLGLYSLLPFFFCCCSFLLASFWVLCTDLFQVLIVSLMCLLMLHNGQRILSAMISISVGNFSDHCNIISLPRCLECLVFTVLGNFLYICDQRVSDFCYLIPRRILEIVTFLNEHLTVLVEVKIM